MNQLDLMTRQEEREAKMQTIAKAKTTMTNINSQLAEVEKLVYANSPNARAALAELAVTLQTADQELTIFEKLVAQPDDHNADDQAPVLKFAINLPRRTN